jgi:hypothetical protein
MDLTDQQVREVAEHFGISEAYVRSLPKHKSDCSLNTTHHLTCTCGAYRRQREASS